MQQRRLRLGDILDDYCPRERRVTNHAIVAMIDEEVRQTRCTTCDADHEYRHAKMPTSRKKKDSELAAVAAPAPKPVAAASAEPPVEAEVEAAEAGGELEAPGEPPPTDDEGPVHRRLIRATLPRPEGQPPPQAEWKEPEFTVRQPGSGNGGRDRNRPGGQRRGRGRRRGQQGGGQGARFGHEANGNRQPRGEANGNRAPSGERGDGGRHRGPRPGRKRGR